jgi:hypothetical protein
MPEGSQAERRRHPREPRKFLVKYRVVGGPVPRDIADRVGQVMNLSRGGILLAAKRPLPAGAMLEMRFPENALGGGSRTLGGVVRYVGPETPGGDTLMGLMFVRIVAKPSEAGGAERRRAARAPQRLLLRLRCVTEGLFKELEPRGGLLANISKGGMEVSTTRDYVPGCVLELHLPENPLGGGKIVYGRVAWAKPGEKEGHYRLGLSLLQSPEGR